MPTQILKSLKGRRIRLTRLDYCGQPIEGACTTVVTDGFIQVTLSGELEEGDEFIQKNAWGELCISDKNPSQFKRVTVSIELCEVDPTTVSVVGGDSIIELEDSLGAVVGHSVNTIANLDAFAIEIWTKAAGQACAIGTEKWGYFVVPFIKNGRPDGDITIANETLTFSLYGEGFPVDGWDQGPYGDDPIFDGFPDGGLWAIAITDAQPPNVTNGCVPYTAL